MKRVNILASGACLLNQTFSGVASAASVTLAGIAVEFKLTMQELDHEFN
jgi:hypothetical protein